MTNGIIQLERRGADEVASFTLRGYKLKWNGGESSLPELKPGTVVDLFSSTGYNVAESQ